MAGVKMRFALVVPGALSGALFGWGDAIRALLRDGNVLAGPFLTASVLLHATLGALVGLVLGIASGPRPILRALLIVGTPVTFVVLLANVDGLPAFTAPISLATDLAGLLVTLVGAGLLSRRLGRRRPVATGVAAVGLVLGAFALPWIRPLKVDEGPVPLLDGRTETSVVVVVVDTLRADALSVYGYEKPTDPHLRELAADGVVIEETRAASTWTKPSTATILTGLHPAVHGAVLHDAALPPEAETLAEILRAAGHRTAAFSANPWISPTFGFGQGFDRFEARRASVLASGTLFGKAVFTLQLRSKNVVTRALWRGLLAWESLVPAPGASFDGEPSADTLVDRALDWLEESEGPFFLYLHLMEPHTPYDPPEPHRGRFDPGGDGPLPDRHPAYVGMLPWDRGPALSPTELRRLRAAYDGEVAAADAAIGRLLKKLEKRDALESTLVCVLSDHGEEFHEHGAWGHGHSLHREVCRVPWILRLPGRAAAGRRVAGAASTADLVPTVLDLLGLTSLDPERESNGISLVEAIRGEGKILPGRVVYSEVTTGTESLRLAATARSALLEHEGRGDRGVVRFDLESDPLEREPLDAAGSELIRALEEGFEALRKQALRSGRAAMTDGEREALRGLGYLR